MRRMLQHNRSKKRWEEVRRAWLAWWAAGPQDVGALGAAGTQGLRGWRWLKAIDVLGVRVGAVGLGVDDDFA